jgi:hypothetical protein
MAIDFSKYSLIHEFDGIPIVEEKGEFFLLSDEEFPNIAVVESKKEEGEFMAFRRSVGVGAFNPQPYSPIFTDAPNHLFHRGAFSQGEFLPHTNVRYYKKIMNPNELPIDAHHFVYDKDKHQHYCIRNVCSMCEHNPKCNVELEKVELAQPTRIVSLDLSAQEPVLLTLRSREPRWAETFRNKHLRVSGVLNFLEPIMAKKFSFEPNNINQAIWYWKWVSQFDYNSDRIVEFNHMIIEYNNTKVFPQSLDDAMEWFFDSYESFLNKVNGVK